MAPHNPAQHPKIAADALNRMVQDVRTGRAEWAHPHTVRQAVDDLTRLSDAMATAVQQMTAALAQLGHGSLPHQRQSAAALHMAGQAATTAAAQLRLARRGMH
ncbi:hypothetical protein OG285_38390 [Streptomyces sp. NBC_01471]|uniref:hypothetical protein n=1 Tax=Streptomyces sp. NBC_01471 TaxID=2903879 RepID=UPI0032457184